MTRTREHTVLPPEDPAVLRVLASFMAASSQPAGLVRATGERIELPADVYGVLVDVVQALAAGRAVTVAPTSTRLTTQQAADLLGVSRPTLVKLLEDGRIPYDQPGQHRRVRLVDLLDYQETTRRHRRAELDELTQDAVAGGGYNDTADDFRAALAQARRTRGSQAAG